MHVLPTRSGLVLSLCLQLAGVLCCTCGSICSMLKLCAFFLLGFSLLIEMEWNKDQCLQFVEDYHQYPEMWLSTEKDYKDKQNQHDTLQNLAQKYSWDPKSILKKIKSSRSYFHKEHFKVINKNGG
jgi:hypothetical protein